MRWRRARTALITAAVLLGGACGGSEPTTTTVDASEARAEEYALSARRALADTRFEALGDGWLIDLVLEGCERLAAGGDAAVELTALALGAAAGVPPAEATEDEILAEVLVAGVADVCPEALASATTTTVPDVDPEDDYLRVVGPIADEAGLSVLPGTLVAAGRAVCDALDAGVGPEQGVLDAAEIVLGVSVADIADLEDQEGVVAADGAVLGSVLGAAAAFLCPDHADTVMSYVAVLEARE